MHFYSRVLLREYKIIIIEIIIIIISKMKAIQHFYCDISTFPVILKWLHKNDSLTLLVILKV